jgi:hypothetical protein
VVAGVKAELKNGPVRVTILFDGSISRICALRGEEQPIAGWYSAGFDRKEPSWTLCAETETRGDLELVTRIMTH